MVMGGIFLELGVIVIIATALGLLARLLKQPPLLAYLITGVLLGPSVLNLLASAELLRTLSSIGIAFLLFIVGLNLNARVLKEVGPIALVTGIGQVLFTAVIGYAITRWLGFAPLPALYISVALTFSSTIIIVKLLTDKNDLDTLYGKIAVGFLLIQDFVAVLALIFISSLSNGTELGYVLFLTLLKALGLFLIVYVLYKLVIKPCFSSVSKNQELLFLGGIAWCFLIAIIGWNLGFGVEIGAFLAGFALSSSQFGLDISSKIKPLRDFFIAMFFINLGITMVFSSFKAFLFPIIIFSVFILIGNPLIVFFLMIVMGYRSRTSFFAGLTVAQISEFSLILMAIGLSAQHVSRDASIVVTTVGIITITGSTYLILYGDKIFNLFSRFLKIFERKYLIENLTHRDKKKKYDIILFGCHRIGYNIVDKIKNKKILVVDFNPELVKRLNNIGVDTVYADINDIEIIEELAKLKPKILISTITELDANKIIVNAFKGENRKCTVFVTVKNAMDYLELYKIGADFVNLPEILASDKIVASLNGLNVKKIRKDGKEDYDRLVDQLRNGNMI